jgi:hypothetical protein
MSIAVCFPPGAGGHFVGSLIKSVVTNHSIVIDESGHAHHNQLPILLLGLTKNGIDQTIDSYCYEHVELTQSLVHPVAVGHVRNLVQCLNKYDRVVYITFTPEDIPTLKKKYFSKNAIVKVSEIDYNKIKGESWPLYSQYLTGTEVPELSEHVDSPIESWYWIVPAYASKLHEIPYQDVVGESTVWISKLFEFLEITLTDTQQTNLLEARNNYLAKQPK